MGYPVWHVNASKRFPKRHLKSGLSNGSSVGRDTFPPSKQALAMATTTLFCRLTVEKLSFCTRGTLLNTSLCCPLQPMKVGTIVFEPWTATGSELLSCLTSLRTTTFISLLKYLFTSRDDWFENRGETTVLVWEMFSSGFRPWLESGVCLSSLLALGSFSNDDGAGNKNVTWK